MATAIAPLSQAPGALPEGTARDLLLRWLELGEVERRAFRAMTDELSGCLTDVESSTVALSGGFRELADAAEAQAERAQAVARLAETVIVEGAAMPLAEAVAVVERGLAQGLAALAQVAAQAGRMAVVLSAVEQDVANAEQCVARIEAINKQARFVALNATIEAHRAEGAGGTFKVIAQELKELSQETDTTSRLVRDRIASVAGGVRQAHAELRSIAALQEGDDSLARHQLQAVMAGILQQNAALGSVLAEAEDASAGMATVVSRLITHTQFQDRTSQRLTHVMDALGVIGEATGQLQQECAPLLPEGSRQIGLETDLLQRLLSRQSLSSVQHRFLAQLLGDQPAPASVAPAAGDVELF